MAACCSLILTRSPTNAGTCIRLCHPPHPVPTPFPFSSFFIHNRPYFGWRLLSLPLPAAQDGMSINSLIFYSCAQVQILIFPAFLHSLLSGFCASHAHPPPPPTPPSLAPCTTSTKAPLFYVSLDNGSGILTLAVT